MYVNCNVSGQIWSIRPAFAVKEVIIPKINTFQNIILCYCQGHLLLHLKVLTGNEVIYQVKKILNLKLKGFLNFRLYLLHLP